MSQYDAAALKTELHNDIEALRKKLRSWSSRVSASNPFFAESEFDTHTAECLDALRQDLAGMIDDADEALADHEASDGLEPGETYRPIREALHPYPRAAE